MPGRPRQLSLFETQELNADARVAEAMRRAVDASGLSREQAVDRLNIAARLGGVRLCNGNAKELSLATFNKWLNPLEGEHVPSLRALGVFLRCFESAEVAQAFLDAVGLGWRVIDREQALTLEYGREMLARKRSGSRLRKLESELL